MKIDLYKIVSTIVFLTLIVNYVDNGCKKQLELEYLAEYINTIRPDNYSYTENGKDPSKEQLIIINCIKDEFLRDINISDKLTNDEKDRINSGVKQIKFYLDNLVTPDKSYNGLFINETILNDVNSKYIILDKDIFTKGYRYTILHELRHYVDNLLTYDDNIYRCWSEKYNIKRILDPTLMDDNIHLCHG